MNAQILSTAASAEPIAATHDAPLIELEGVTKSYGGVRALRGVHFDLQPGEVHALLGQNGAGKSTLIKVLAGAVPRDGGAIRVDGVDTQFRSPAASRDAGIAVVYQELSLVPQMTIADNLYLAREPNALGLVRRRQMLADAAKFIEGHGLDLNPATPVRDLPFAYRQLTEIVKALSGNVRILILDEPTSSLSKGEENILFDAVEQVTRRGVGVIYITHRLSEVFRLSDRVTVLRDGQNVATYQTSETNIQTLVGAIVGSDGQSGRLSAISSLGPGGEEAAPPESVQFVDDDLSSARAKELRVAVSLHTDESDWARQQCAGIRETLDKCGAELVSIESADFDAQKQIAQLGNLVDARPDAIIAIPVDAQATADAFRAVRSAGIELVLMDNAPAGLRAGRDYACVTSADNFGLGRIAAQILSDHVPDGGTVAIVGFARLFFATDQRAAGFREWWAENRSDASILRADFEEPEDAGRIGLELLTAHPETDGVFVAWDEPAMALVEALRSAGRSIAMTTVDLGYQAAVDLAQGGMIKGIAAQQPFEQGALEASAAVCALLGRPTPAWIALPGLSVTRENVLEAYGRVWRVTPPQELSEALATPNSERSARKGRREAGAAPATDSATPPLVELENASNDRLKDIDLAIRPGEIVGLAGMIGSGRTEILETIFGLRKLRSGVLRIDGKAVRLRDPADAIRHGIGLVPEDRHLQGLVLAHSIERNTVLPWLSRLGKWGLFRRGAAQARTRETMDGLSVKAPSPTTRVQNLSGGNQQKVVFGRWREPGMRLLLLDEPTVGVDVGAREQIYDVVRDVVSGDAAALVVSSDLAELLLLCDRIAIVVDGCIVGEHDRTELRNEEHLHQLVQEHQS